MNDKTAGAPVYSKEFDRLMERLKNREETKKMSDQELHDIGEAVTNEIVRRKVVKHIQMLADQFK